MFLNSENDQIAEQRNRETGFRYVLMWAYALPCFICYRLLGRFLELVEQLRRICLLFLWLTNAEFNSKNDQMNELNSCANDSTQRTCNEVGYREYYEWYSKRVKTAVVVTFVWQEMNSKEQCSFKQGYKILGSHPFVVVHPQSFFVDDLKQEYPTISTLALPDEYFKSVESYNKMMLSSWFYNLFLNYEYMLIYQLDAYVFSDQLDYWTTLEYDYIGAPWMLNDNLYQRLIGQWVTRLLQKRAIRNNHVHSAHLFHKVGNGGFSLRRISKMKEIMEKNKEFISSLTGKHERQEDVIISILLAEKEHLKIPDWHLALYFSFEKAPEQCLEYTHDVFPFGCHNLNNRYWDAFWKYYIPIEE